MSSSGAPLYSILQIGLNSGDNSDDLEHREWDEVAAEFQSGQLRWYALSAEAKQTMAKNAASDDGIAVAKIAATKFAPIGELDLSGEKSGRGPVLMHRLKGQARRPGILFIPGVVGEGDVALSWQAQRTTVESDATMGASTPAAALLHGATPRTVRGTPRQQHRRGQTPSEKAAQGFVTKVYQAVSKVEQKQVRSVEAQIKRMVSEIEPTCTIDEGALRTVRKVVESFVAQVTRSGSDLARHRGSAELEVKDLKLCLEREWGIDILGFAATEGGSGAQSGTRRRGGGGKQPAAKRTKRSGRR